MPEPIAEQEKGGPGSGDFGHRGRPGQVGGSAPKGAKGRAIDVLYHGTAVTNAKKILKDGLLSSASGGLPGKVVWASSDRRMALSYAVASTQKWASEHKIHDSDRVGKMPVALVVARPRGERMEAGTNTFVIRNKVSPKDIVRVEVYQLRDVVASGYNPKGKAAQVIRKEDETEHYVPVPTDVLLAGVEVETESRKVVIKSEEERLVYAEVYAPLHVDTDTECMTAEEIKKAAHGFLSRGLTTHIDVSHSKKESGCLVVESFLARENDPDGFVLGSWVLGVKVVPDDLWQAVKSGELNGFSFMASVLKVPAKVRVLAAKRLIGDTEESTEDTVPPHSHSIDLMFDSEGRIIAGKTSEDLEHDHDVLRATATESQMGHSHRMILIEE